MTVSVIAARAARARGMDSGAADVTGGTGGAATNIALRPDDRSVAAAGGAVATAAVRRSARASARALRPARSSAKATNAAA